MADSAQAPDGKPPFRLGPLGNLNQVVRALGKVIRAMADGSIGSQHGARLANALGIMRACLETAKLEDLSRRLDELEEPASGRYSHEGQERRLQ